MASHYQHLDVPSQSQQVDDIYNVSPQQTGVTPAAPPGYSKQQPTMMGTQDDASDTKETRPPLPPRRSSSIRNPPNDNSALAPVSYQRSKERAMAYMVPLPQPLGTDRVPQRYMLYLPPAPDRLKPRPDAEGNVHERKRDKAQRRWQAEVKKAKTYNGAVISPSGLYAASVRGAVHVLALLQRSELTFLSRLPRGKTLRELTFVVQPNDDDDDKDDQARFEEVRAEFKRNRRTAKRDFWIATALLPFATAVDIAIPVFGGFSEVDLVWMVVTGRAWFAAKGAVRRMVLADGSGSVDNGESQAMQQQQQQQEEESTGSKFKFKGKKKAPPPSVAMSFRPSPDMDALAQYVGAVCHARNPDMFPDVGPTPGEAGVLASIGWAPEKREVEDCEDDVAWQIRQTTEDLRVAAAKAAKTWEKWCMKQIEKGEVEEKRKSSDEEGELR